MAKPRSSRPVRPDTTVPKSSTPAATPQPPGTVGYDSAQKAGYDTEHEAPEARRSTNAVDSAASAAHHEREQVESDARRA